MSAFHLHGLGGLRWWVGVGWWFVVKRRFVVSGRWVVWHGWWDRLVLGVWWWAGGFVAWFVRGCLVCGGG